jgi:hypothetical protein
VRTLPLSRRALCAWLVTVQLVGACARKEEANVAPHSKPSADELSLKTSAPPPTTQPDNDPALTTSDTPATSPTDDDPTRTTSILPPTTPPDDDPTPTTDTLPPPPTTDDEPTPTAGVPPPTTQTADEQWLIWAFDGTPPRARTAAVSVYADGTLAIATHEGLTVAHGTALYRAAWDVRLVESMDCLCVNRQDEARIGRQEIDTRPCSRLVHIREPRLTVSDGATIELHRIDNDGLALFPRQHEPNMFRVYWTGGAGPLLTANICTHIYHCGAMHGNSGCVRSIWDLRTGLPWVDNEVHAHAQATLVAEDDPTPFVTAGGGEPVVLRGRRPVSNWPSPGVNADGVFVWRHQYAYDTCYACSDGWWTSDTSSFFIDRIPANGPPAGLEPPPASVLNAAMQALDNANISGWSRYEGRAWPPPYFLDASPITALPSR